MVGQFKMTRLKYTYKIEWYQNTPKQVKINEAKGETDTIAICNNLFVISEPAVASFDYLLELNQKYAKTRQNVL